MPSYIDSSSEMQAPKMAVLIPCYNEAVTIETVIRDFSQHLPEATVYVYDNNSTDNTVELARKASAVVRTVTRQGKGHVVQRMFADIDADIYILVDGDATYAASSAPLMVKHLQDDALDMVVGCRETDEKAAYRLGHRFGNQLLTHCVATIFGWNFTDMLSGYRIFSRRFVKSFPALSSGFETETELTIHALELRMPIAEVATPYAARPVGSSSKLNTYRDGFRILITIAKLFIAERPFVFFGGISALLAISSVLLTLPLLFVYWHTGLVPRLPTAVLATGIMLVSMALFSCGIILNMVTRARQEMKRLAYLAIPLKRY